MGFMGSMPDRRRHLAAHPLHRRPATARARRLLHRRFRPAALQRRRPSIRATTTRTPRKFSPNWRTNSASNVAGLSARAIFPENPTAGLALDEDPAALSSRPTPSSTSAARRNSTTTCSRATRILYIESDPGRGADQGRQGHPVHRRLSRDSIAPSSPLAKTSAPNGFPVPLHKLKWLPTRQPVVTDLWKTNRAPGDGRRLHLRSPTGPPAA